MTSEVVEIKLLTKRRILLLGAVAAAIIAFVPGYYFYSKYQKLQQLMQKNPLVLQLESKSIVDQVARLMKLPEDEEPTVATVSDIEKLRDQPFFAKAKNGDKVLIYNKAQRAILYDPLADKILEVGPLMQPPTTPTLSIAQTPTVAAELTPTPTLAQKLKVYLYNGSSKVGLTNLVEKELVEKDPNIEVVDKDYAQKRDYKETLVIDLTGGRKGDAEKLAKILKAEVSTLPAGETKPEGADILVIVGEDKK